MRGNGHTHEHFTHSIRQPNGDVPLQPDNPYPSATCQFPGFMLSSDTGFDNGLGGSGTVQLIPGRYTGVSGYEIGTGFYWMKEGCKWTLTLAP